MNGTKVERVQSCKYLVVTMDEKWSWKPYISNLLKKLGHRLCLTESFICLIIRLALRILTA